MTRAARARSTSRSDATVGLDRARVRLAPRRHRSRPGRRSAVRRPAGRPERPVPRSRGTRRCPPAGRRPTAPATLDWLSHYRGGWQVMFPNAGAECTVDGLPHPVHGEVSSAPAEVLERVGHRRRSPVGDPAPAPPRAPDLARGRAGRSSLSRSASRTSRTGRCPTCGVTIRRIAASPGMRIDLPVGPLHVDEAFDDPVADLAPGAVGMWPEVAAANGWGSGPRSGPGHAVSSASATCPDRPAGWAAVREPVTRPRRRPRLGRRRVPAPLAVATDERPSGSRSTVGHGWSGSSRSCWPGDGLARAIERGQARTIAPHGERDRLDHAVPVRGNDRRRHQRRTRRFASRRPTEATRMKR